MLVAGIILLSIGGFLMLVLGTSGGMESIMLAVEFFFLLFAPGLVFLIVGLSTKKRKNNQIVEEKNIITFVLNADTKFLKIINVAQTVVKR